MSEGNLCLGAFDPAFDPSFVPQKIISGRFVDVFTTPDKSKIRRQYKHQSPRTYGMFQNEMLVYQGISSKYVHTASIPYRGLYFVEERAYCDLFGLLETMKGNFPATMIEHVHAHLKKGLDAFQERGIMVLDLKLENVLVFVEKTVDGHWGLIFKLADFNMAEGLGLVDLDELERSKRIRAIDTCIDMLCGGHKRRRGTYFAPEEYRESIHSVGLAADVFRLGIVLFILSNAIHPHVKKVLPHYDQVAMQITYNTMQNMKSNVLTYIGDNPYLKYLEPHPETRYRNYVETSVEERFLQPAPVDGDLEQKIIAFMN